MGEHQKFDWAASTASLIGWWREAGVDVSIAEEPRNWLAPVAEIRDDPRAATDMAASAPVIARAVPSPSAPARLLSPLPTDIAAFEAWRMGNDAPDSAWTGVRLGAEGTAQSRLMVVVEMPERDDAAAGALLSGAVGALFDRMLAAIGQDRASIYLVPMCIVRPNTGSIPPDTMPALAAALRQQVALAAPKRVLIFGNAASRALLGADIAEMRGALRPINRNCGEDLASITAVASFHPRFLIERPAAKAEAWKDLLLLAQGIDA